MSCIAHLKRRRAGNVPTIPPLPLPAPYDPNPVVARCGECGLELRRAMGYACQNPRCPTGLGPTIIICKTEDYDADSGC